MMRSAYFPPRTGLPTDWVQYYVGRIIRQYSGMPRLSLVDVIRDLSPDGRIAMSIFRFRRFRTARAGATAIVFALAFLAMMLVVAVAIDFGGAAAAKTKLDLAADAAAMTAATTASQMFVAGGSTSAQIQAAATTAGQNWFVAAFGSISNVATPSVPSINRHANRQCLYRLVDRQCDLHPLLRQLLGVSAVPLSAFSTISVALSAPYLNVEILLDNSGSMEIAATPSDIATMQELTACALTGAYYLYGTTTTTTTTGHGRNQTTTTTTTCNNWAQSSGLPTTDPYHTTSSSGQGYGAYACSSGAYSYSGSSPACPFPPPPWTVSPFRPFP